MELLNVWPFFSFWSLENFYPRAAQMREMFAFEFSMTKLRQQLLDRCKLFVEFLSFTYRLCQKRPRRKGKSPPQYYNIGIISYHSNNNTTISNSLVPLRRSKFTTFTNVIIWECFSELRNSKAKSKKKRNKRVTSRTRVIKHCFKS